jgi:two-component system, sensor histidine kinase PhcS
LLAAVPNLKSPYDLQAMGPFLSNTLFIILTSVILYFGSLQQHLTRLREFLNRCKVEAQREVLRARNSELTDALQKLKEAEAQLTQNEKLASVGRLSAGIVHEINNPLNFVKSAVFVLRKRLKNLSQEQAEGIQEILNDISEGVQRVVSIVSDLRTFSHPESKGSMPVLISEVVAKAARLMNKQLLDEGVELRAVVPPELYVLGDENHIIQILLNLMQNSLDAVHGSAEPEILIQATAEVESAAFPVTLKVRDNGNGMPPELMQRIFDPFFTTKEVGKGMGLGLSLCFRMMQGMGGQIEVRSKIRSHTEFILSFQAPPYSNESAPIMA